MIDPSVHTVLIGHSMGGIVAAETLLLVANEHPIHPTSREAADHRTNFASNTTLNSTTGTSHPALHQSTSSPPDLHLSMFPQITGLLAFDTPFLGLSPGVIAHGAEGHYKTASSAYNTFNELSSAFGWGGPKSPSAAPQALPKALPASASGDAAASPRWQSWGKYAMFAGAAGAVAAGGAAALYSQRERISSGWGWVSGHLEFVGCLIKGEELRERIERVGQLGKQAAEGEDGDSDRETRFRGAYVLYTLLGRGAANTGDNAVSASMSDGGRTFVKLPPNFAQKAILSGSKDPKTGLEWLPATNDKAPDEISAHMSMFFPRDNPGFYALGERAKEIISGWVYRNQKWYEDSSSSASHPTGHRGFEDHGMSDGPSGWSGPGTYGEVGDDGWEKPDYDASDVRDKQRSKDDHNGFNANDIPPPSQNLHPDPDPLHPNPYPHQKPHAATAGDSPRERERETEPVWIHARDLDDADVWMREDDEHANNGTSEGGEKLESSVVVDKAK